MFGPTNRITYEEVVDGTRPVQTKKVLGVEVAAGVCARRIIYSGYGQN